MKNTKTLEKRIQKVGIKASKKEGHLLSEAELKKLKIQIVPNSVRGISWALACGSGYGSYLHFSNGNTLMGILLAALATLFTLFAIFGIKRTLANILDGLVNVDPFYGAEFLGEVIVTIAEKVGDTVKDIDIDLP